jgi:MoaA/NifB/PqqE/SkfB family radical SAM enzyme
MKPEDIARYHGSRRLADKAVRSMCYAPHTNIFFGMNGQARACCWNWAQPIGNVQTDTMDEIWAGAKAALLRRKLEADDFSAGCFFCDRQTADGWTERAVMRTFDQFPVAAADPQWPQRMEFSISNSCNLECVMCTGTFSSAIRAHREKLPPAQCLYSREFIDSLKKYLPHLKRAKFLGGEPFLITEYYHIWDMMVEVAPHVPCHITTNGTLLTRRVEHYMEKLNFAFAVSLDGATKKTVESIRVNADFDVQMANLKRFKEYTSERKTDLSITFCFMRQNWHEFGAFCLLADEWDCNVGINTVSKPVEMAVNNLPLAELREVVRVMEGQSVELEGKLKRNRNIWLAEVKRLRLKCESMARGELAGAAPG